MKKLSAVCFLGCLLAAAHAQTGSTKESDLLKSIGNPGSPDRPEQNSTSTNSASGKGQVGGAKPKDKGKGSPPTEITCTTEATYDNKTRQAVFVGNVRVTDPQFTITTDKLTAILRDNSAAGTTPPPADSTSGELDHAIAEGHVVIVQIKPAEDGGPPKRYVGKAEKAVYDAKTGDVTLTGWPQIQQGINTQVATEASTVMILNRGGQMRTRGGSKTVIQESAGP